MKLQKIFRVALITSLLFGFTQAFAWTKVYEHDSSGGPLYGNIQTLIDAVKNGYDVKVSWGDFLIIKATTVRVDDTTDGVKITATLHESNSVTWNNTDRIFPANVTYNSYLVSTSGKFNHQYYSPTSGSYGTSTVQTKAMIWYVMY